MQRDSDERSKRLNELFNPHIEQLNKYADQLVKKYRLSDFLQPDELISELYSSLKIERLEEADSHIKYLKGALKFKLLGWIRKKQNSRETLQPPYKLESSIAARQSEPPLVDDPIIKEKMKFLQSRLDEMEYEFLSDILNNKSSFKSLAVKYRVSTSTLYRWFQQLKYRVIELLDEKW